MDGYGRYLALIIFSIWLFSAVKESYKQDKKETISILKAFIFGSLILAFILLIYYNW